MKKVVVVEVVVTIQEGRALRAGDRIGPFETSGKECKHKTKVSVRNATAAFVFLGMCDFGRVLAKRRKKKKKRVSSCERVPDVSLTQT